MTQQAQDVVLRISRRFDAPRERVFDAWTNPDVLLDWWRAGPHWETPTAEVDLRPGGRYRLAMTDTDKNETHVVVGEYREIQPPERLVYTWSWESKTDEMSGSENTLVTVEFAEADGGTEVSLTHRGFAGEEIRDLHTHGWDAVLASLERQLSPGGRS
jgi:uncharacterized protein YndB with AHSA1/START domain